LGGRRRQRRVGGQCCSRGPYAPERAPFDSWGYMDYVGESNRKMGPYRVSNFSRPCVEDSSSSPDGVLGEQWGVKQRGRFKGRRFRGSKDEVKR
jgi:hypothetical protein